MINAKPVYDTDLHFAAHLVVFPQVNGSLKVSVGGVGGGVDDDGMFDKVMKPAIVNLIAKPKAANPVK